MGGASTEIDATTTDLLIEGAHFTASAISRSARRHGLLSEASRRFERGVDPAVAPVAVQRAADLLAEFGAATPATISTDVGDPAQAPTIRAPSTSRLESWASAIPTPRCSARCAPSVATVEQAEPATSW